MTIKQLANEFLHSYAEKRLRASTIRGYETNIRLHILPVIGDEHIRSITPEDLDKLNDSMTKLSNKSKIYAHATLRKMLNFAIRRNELYFNPYEVYDLPRANKKQIQTLSEEEAAKMLTKAKGYYVEAPITLALKYGLRRGECLGIIPEQDVDKKQKTLHIQRTRGYEKGKEIITPCKTDRSNRYILLADEDIEMLCGRAGAVLQILTPNMLQHYFRYFCWEYGFGEIRFHDLRHTFATLMMKRKVNPVIVRNILGHSSVKVTLDTYSHPDTQIQQICLDAFSEITKKQDF